MKVKRQAQVTNETIIPGKVQASQEDTARTLIPELTALKACIIKLPRWLRGKESACQCRRRRFDPWVGKIPWRRKWQPTPVFLPGKSHGWRRLVGYSPWGRKESDTI